MAAMFRVWPITPVEATTKSAAFSPVAAAARAHISSAFSWLMGQQALALPELAMMPWATPFSRWSMVTYRGAAFTRLRIYMAAAAHSFSETMRARSFFWSSTSGRPLLGGWLPSPLPFLTPQWTPEA